VHVILSEAKDPSTTWILQVRATRDLQDDKNNFPVILSVHVILRDYVILSEAKDP